MHIVTQQGSLANRTFASHLAVPWTVLDCFASSQVINELSDVFNGKIFVEFVIVDLKRSVRHRKGAVINRKIPEALERLHKHRGIPPQSE